MSVKDMFKSIMTVKILIIFIGLLIFSFGNTTVWLILGGLMLLVCMFLCFRQGQGCGHEACAASKAVERALATGHEPDKETLRGVYSVTNGFRFILAGGLIGYVINCIYVILMNIGIPEVPLMISRLLSWGVILPYWPIIGWAHPVYNVLTWDIVILQMVGPFFLPFCQFLGYLQGPKLWAKTEKAMADGRRRAKARSRIFRKKNNEPKHAKPLV